MARPEPLCSNHCCTEVATVLAPRHLCTGCAADPALNGPELVFINEVKKEKKPDARRTRARQAP